MFEFIALLFIFGIPALVAYVIALFAYKRLVKKGNTHPRRARIIIFSASYMLLFVAEVVLLLNTISFER